MKLPTKFKYVVSIFLLSSSFSYAEVCSLTVGAKLGNTFNGPTTCNKGRINSIVVNGPLTLNGTTITDKIELNGPCLASNVNVNKLIINGVLDAKSSAFNEITAHGILRLTDSKVNSIVIPASKFSHDSEKICLIEKTIVANISCLNGNCMIFKQETAKITGIVSGANVQEFSSKECLN